MGLSKSSTLGGRDTRSELQLAALRVKEKGQRLTISAVAREAGVTPSLIHNTYPDIAESLRAQMGRDVRQRHDAVAASLAASRQRAKSLRRELEAALADVARLASMNESLRQEVATLRAVVGANVVLIPRVPSGPRP